MCFGGWAAGSGGGERRGDEKEGERWKLDHSEKTLDY